MIYIIMGVSGCGKSTFGMFLSEKLGWPLYEGDDFHPQENIEKMSRGEALTDQDRLPWLLKLHDIIQSLWWTRRKSSKGEWEHHITYCTPGSVCWLRMRV